VPPESKDPIVYHHPTRKSIGYFAAVRLRDGELLFHRETERFNGKSFWEFLKVFRDVSAVAVPARVGQQRQCATSPLQIASTLALSAGSSVRLGAPSSLQS
jgi:hypothetical protein